MNELKESKIISQKIVFQAKWLGMSQIDFTIGDKVVSNYESVYRTHKKAKALPYDGVQIIPILKKKGRNPQILVIANFRPSIGKFCIQFPAGLLQNQNCEQNALRELKQQTGYIAQKILKVPLRNTFCDPWKSSQTGLLYLGIINEDDPQHKVSQDLQSDENIRVYRFELNKDLNEKVNSFLKQNDYEIHSKVWAFILGFNLNLFL